MRAGTLALAPALRAAEAKSTDRYETLNPVAGPVVLFPAGKRVPAGWPAFAVGPMPTILQLAPATDAPAGPAASPRHTQFRSR